MAEFNLPGDVRRFLLATIPSVPHLEALVLIRERRAMVVISMTL